MMDNFKLRWFLGIMFLILAGAIVWWMFFYAPYRPKIYIGFTQYYGEVPEVGEGGNIDFPSYVMEIDINKGVVEDTFPVSENVPRVAGIAVDKKRGLLYVAGSELVRHPIHGHMKSQGIDIYNLKTKKLKKRITFPHPETGEPRNTYITTLRFTPDYELLFINNPLKDRNWVNERERKQTWIINPQTGELKNSFCGSLTPYLTISEAGKYISRDSRDWIYSTKSETYVEEVKNDQFVVDYPQIRGTNPVKFYDRESGELLGEVDLAGQGETIIRAREATFPTSLTKDKKYVVSRVLVKKETNPDETIPYLKIIDLEKLQVIRSIRIDGFEKIRGMTYMAVY